MKPPPFAYARPAELDEALELLDDAGEDAKLIAGGQSLMPLLAYRLARPSHLVDIGRIEGLDTVEQVNGGLAVGALVRHAQLERRVDLPAPWHALTEAAGLIGHYPIRVQGTFGGSMAHADPAAELPVVATALGADFVVRSRSGNRTIPVEEFFAGPFMTVVEPDEVLVRVDFRPAPAGRRSVFEEFSIRHGDFATAAVAVALVLDEDGCARDVRIALGAVGPLPARAAEAEAALEGSPLRDSDLAAAGRLAAETCEPYGEARNSADFRHELVDVLVRRALRRVKETA
ncbi:FAD binding domain-containing protein [Kribbella sp. NPDC050241]|uniref:FAD binding domain-containing protein n=1 Tax=Kribbella sp. NPDC050241 TaxID=3364115 RepID=UPI0037AB04B5